MNLKSSFKELTHFELGLWLSSIAVVAVSFIIARQGVLSLVASLIGVTALIFIAKGMVLGQVLVIAFALLYGIVSLRLRYYGEMLTYVFMSAPMALISMLEWLRHPYRGTKVVEVSRVTPKKLAVMCILCALVTMIFYFVLRALGTASLALGTLSIATSFIAVYLTALRSPYYAIGYSANDLVLIALWIIATIKDISYLPMIACFTMFLANDIYGFINWKRMQKSQAE